MSLTIGFMVLPHRICQENPMLPLLQGIWVCVDTILQPLVISPYHQVGLQQYLNRTNRERREEYLKLYGSF